MSIINQALKKAQREQLLHEIPQQPYVQHRPSPRLHPVWWLIGVGGIVVLGVSTMQYGWLSTTPQRTEERQRPPIARQASAPVLPQPALPRPVTTAPVPTTPADTAVNPVPAPAPTTPADTAVNPIPAPAPTTPADTAASSTSKPVRPTLAATPGDHFTSSTRRSSQLTPPPLPTPRIVASAAPLTTPAPFPVRPGAQALFQHATELQDRGQHTHAITLLQEAVAVDTTFKEAYSKLGNLYYKQQAYRQALDSFQKVLALDPGDVKAHNNLGSTYLRLDLDEQARDVLHQAVSLDQTYGLAYYNLACAYARLGDSTTTVQYLKHAISIEPQARDWAQTDDDFRRVRNAPELRQLLGTTSW